jgi:hypothetical protein
MLAANPQSANPSPPPSAMTIKPISGSWAEFQHSSTVEGVDWNATCASFTGQQWDAKIKEIAQVGMEYWRSWERLSTTARLSPRQFSPSGIWPALIRWRQSSPRQTNTV